MYNTCCPHVRTRRSWTSTCAPTKADESGAIQWANLIVVTGHNNLAINHSVGQVARHFIDGNQMKEGMLNRVSAVVRAYDPCLSCSTHADGTLALEMALKGPGGELLELLVTELLHTQVLRWPR